MKPAVPFFSLLALAAACVEFPSDGSSSVIHTATLCFSSSSFNAITITPGSDTVSTTVATSAGTLSWTAAEALTFTQGSASASPSSTVIGPATDVTAASRAGLCFTPPVGFTGDVTITVSTTSCPAASHTVLVSNPLDIDAARAAIMNGIESLHGGNQPGEMACWSEQAQPLAFYPATAAGPMACVATMGAGRVLAIPDHQGLNMGSFAAEGDGAAFYSQSLAWASNVANPASVRVVALSSNVGDYLTAAGYAHVTTLSSAAVTPEALAGADVVIGWLGSRPTEATVDTIRGFIVGGGGAMLADYGAGYSWYVRLCALGCAPHLTPIPSRWWNQDIWSIATNILLRPVGISLTSSVEWYSTLVPTTNVATGVLTTADVIASFTDPSAYTDKELEALGYMQSAMTGALPEDWPALSQMDSGFWARVSLIRATPATPVTDAFERSLLSTEAAKLAALPPEAVTKHHTADDVFGAVPDVPRVTADVTIDTSVTRWASTGLYAAPGELVTVTVPPSAVGVGFAVRLSGHTDSIASHTSLKRVPHSISRSVSLASTTVTIAGAFGGAVYIDVGTTPGLTPAFTATIANVVHAPYFVAGVHTNADWAMARAAPAPYAELVSERVIWSVPAASVADLDDVEATMAFFDAAVAAQDEVSGTAHLRTGPERINIDVQISAGYLHAGYPIQGPTDTNLPMDIGSLRSSPPWGWLHELGHEAQRLPDKSWPWNNAFTFDGSTECTVNVFTVGALDAMGLAAVGGWSWTGAPTTILDTALDAVAVGTYANLGVGDKLAMHLQLKDGFGWQAYTNVIQRFIAEEYPVNDQAKRDAFFTYWCEETGLDLTSFFVGEWQLAITAPLPPGSTQAWLPIVPTAHRIVLPAGDSLPLGNLNPARSMGGDVTVTGCTADAGSFAGGSYVAPGVEGDVQLTCTVASPAGNTARVASTVAVVTSGVLEHTWYGIPGSDLVQLTGSSLYPQSPSEVAVISSMAVSTGKGSDDYGARLQTVFTAARPGTYTFFLASDDNGQLFVDGVLAVEEQYWGSEWDWSRHSTAGFTLTAGQAVKLDAMMKEGGGGDHLSIAFTGPGVAVPTLIGAENAILRVPRGAANVVPTPLADGATSMPGVPVTVAVLANDLDGDGDALVVVGVEYAGSGSVQFTDSTVTFTPGVNGFGDMDEVTYFVADGYGGVASADITVFNAAPSPSASLTNTATPTVSVSSTPRPSVSATASVSESTTPSTSRSATPSTSRSATPSTSRSPTPSTSRSATPSTSATSSTSRSATPSVSTTPSTSPSITPSPSPPPLELVEDTRPLLAHSATWKYADDDTDLGSGWSSATFDDAAWASAATPAGFGVGGEATVTRRNTVTTYFRTTFAVDTNTAATAVRFGLDLLCDDGCVAYVNGVEVARSNMPGGNVFHSTLAASTITGTPDMLAATVPRSLIGEGDNVLAVEVHQRAVQSSDLVFQATMTHTAMVGHLPTRYTTLIPQTSAYAFLDDGSDAGTAWRQSEFDDSLWHVGRTEAGYGDGGEATVVSDGPDPNDKHITTYFRTTAQAGAGVTPTSTAALSLMCDDGCVAYVNGLEVARHNMPNGDIDYLTVAASTAAGARERTFVTFPVAAGVCRQGANTLAVEVHQAGVGSSDLTFDAQLVVETTVADRYDASVDRRRRRLRGGRL